MADDLKPPSVPPARQGDYRMARIGAAIGLTAAVVILLLTRPQVDAVTLGLLLTTIGLLLSVEGIKLIRGQ